MGLHIIVLCLFLSLLADIVRPEEWTHHTVLDGKGKYHLYWKPPAVKKSDSEIAFKVEVAAKGYVGFGFSPNGGMAGSDILTAWIKDGKIYFQDRHGVGNSLPIKDDQQDWKLLSGYENDTHTVFQFSRKLDTCDEKDFVIDDNTMRVIYAYSEDDPESDNPIYHFENRGSKSIILLRNEIKNLVPDLSSLLQWNVTASRTEITADKSLYWCKIYKTPSVPSKHHIVYVKPLIQEGHEQFVHHMILYQCIGGKSSEYDTLLDHKGFGCHHPNIPDPMRNCDGVTVAWGIGGGDIMFPEHVGLPLEPDPGMYFMLETHYDNPQRKSGEFDSSGLSLYYTPILRQFDAGSLMLGSSFTENLIIPPGQKNFVVAGHSNPDCLGPEIPETGIKAFGIVLHSHLLGRQMKARHFRGNEELAPFVEEKNYDFNYQEYRYFSKEVDILQRDQITVECTYDSSGRRNATFGGTTTTDEMCLAFILYYPRINRYGSISAPSIETINKALKTNFSDDLNDISNSLIGYDWSSADIVQIQNVLRNSNHSSLCFFGDSQNYEIESLISYPSEFKPFVKVNKKSPCGDPEENTVFEANSVSSFYKSQSNSAPFGSTHILSLVLCLISLILNG